MQNKSINPRKAVLSHLAHPAFTLLELILALALTSLVLVAIAMALDLHLRTLNARRANVEEAQLARAVLGRIARDIRSAVQHVDIDFSSVESQASASGGDGSAPSDSSGASGGSSGSSGGSSGTSGSSGGGSSGGGSSGGGSSGGGSSGGSSGRSGGGGSSGGSGGGSAGGSSGGSGGSGSTGSGSSGRTSGGTSGSSSGGSSGASTSGGGSSSGGMESDSTSPATADLATNVTPPAKPGIYGNQYQLQVDTSRIPRVEEYQAVIDFNDTAYLYDIPSDVKTVAYYVQTGDPMAASASAAPTSALAEPQVGLIRRELDRAITLWASSSGNYEGLNVQGEVLAPEVSSIQFRYFDGTQWVYEWDSDLQQGLPLAIEIIIGIQSTESLRQAQQYLIPSGAPTFVPELYYRMVVRLPTAKVPTTTEDTSGLEAMGL